MFCSSGDGDVDEEGDDDTVYITPTLNLSNAIKCRLGDILIFLQGELICFQDFLYLVEPELMKKHTS
jgi:hypothetical protein